MMNHQKKKKKKNFHLSNKNPFLIINKSNMTSLINPKEKSIKLSVITNNNNRKNSQSQKKYQI